MATTDSKVLSSSKRRPLATLYYHYFQDDTDSRTACALPSPFPLSAADCMDAQLRERVQLYDRLNRLSQQFNPPLIEAYIAGTVPADVLTAVCLVRFRHDVHELTRQTGQVMASNQQRWLQVNIRR